MDDNADIQVIFNKIIEADIYPYQGARTKSSNYMCHALVEGRKQNIISLKEYFIAVDAIREYLTEYHTLGSFLLLNGYNNGTAVKLNVYKNWNQRPLRK